ncbi:MAG: DUF177 domain-containing protein [Bdellovibrionales bacterium]|nr:DUF177 domain-containing protein [Bdellovibrionales bacterium]
MNNPTKISKQIDSSVPLTGYSHDIIEEYELTDEKTLWVRGILGELHEQLDPEDTYPAGSLKLKLEITRKKSSFLGDHLIVRAEIDARYHLPCGLTLVPLPQHMVHSVNAAFLHDSQEKLPEYAEATTVFADGEEMELYFYRKGMADINEFIHEQIFLEVPAFPRSATSLEAEDQENQEENQEEA